jgi:hypothetical protein
MSPAWNEEEFTLAEEAFVNLHPKTRRLVQ